MTPVEVKQGNSPIVLGLPHTGTFVPDDILSNLNEQGKILADTDWHVHQLYDDLLSDVTTVRATFHRYVIDANRSPEDESLYPGQNTTGLVPTTDFDGEPIWFENPSSDAVQDRLQTYHRPYHEALRSELNRVHAIHGIAILYDCHSIRSNIPFLFEGTLPDFNIGTDTGQTCAPEIETCVTEICAKAEGYTSINNGRFKGGWTTRHYGKPENGFHAIQMELAQSTHLENEQPPFDYSVEKAGNLRVHLSEILESLESLAPKLGGKK